MTRYYFHIRDGQFLVPDEEGIECSNLRAVLDEARASAIDLAQEALWDQGSVFLQSIEVEDERGNKVEVGVSSASLH